MPTPRPRISPSRGAALLVAPVLAAWALALASVPGAVRAQTGAADCDALGDTLAAARGAYAEACPTLPRLDCDPIVGGWACASYRIGAFAPGARADVAAVGPPGVGECRWIDATLEAARAGYAAMCRPARRDCDPVPEGWMCSSQRIGAFAPGVAFVGGAVPDSVFVEPPAPMPAPDDDAPEPDDAPEAPEPDDGFGDPPPPAPEPGDEPEPPLPDGFEPPPAPGASGSGTAASRLVRIGLYDGRYGEPSVSWADSYSANGVCYAASTGDHGVFDLTVATPTGTATVREALGRIERGPGISRADALYNDVRCGRGPANDAGDEDADQCPGRVDLGRAGCATIGPDWRFVR